MDLCIVVHIKSKYDSWKAIFDKDPGNRNSFVDENRTRVGKVDDNMAIVQLFDVDMPKMAKMMNDPNSPVKEVMEEHVVKQEIYTITKMVPPGS
tara:strand:+ start:370 stop:651 length:282 start_codon:yes stop_codon:yes gene_type:complete